jgi:hypothetical protein
MTSTTPVKKPLLTNQAYDVLKFIAQILLPALGTLYFALAAIWSLPHPEQVIGTITAVDVFLGVVLGLSTSSYNKSDALHDGALVISTTDPMKDTYSLELDTPLEDLQNKKVISLKVANLD